MLISDRRQEILLNAKILLSLLKRLKQRKLDYWASLRLDLFAPGQAWENPALHQAQTEYYSRPAGNACSPFSAYKHLRFNKFKHRKAIKLAYKQAKQRRWEALRQFSKPERKYLAAQTLQHVPYSGYKSNFRNRWPTSNKSHWSDDPVLTVISEELQNLKAGKSIGSLQISLQVKLESEDQVD